MRQVVGLIRVSTSEQVETGLSQQYGRLKDAGAENFYVFIGSRDAVNREDIEQMLADVRANKIEKVLITRMDRVTASPGLLEVLTNTFNKHNVRLVALDENIDLSTIDGEFAAILGVAFARRELKTTRQRVAKGNEYRRSQGIASSSCPFGYQRRDGKYVFDKRPFICLLSDRPHTGDFPGRSRADLAKEIKDVFFQCRTLGNATRIICDRYGIQKIGYPGGRPVPKNLVFVLKEDSIDSVINHVKQDKGVRGGCFRPCPSGVKKLLLSAVWAGNTPSRSKTGEKQIIYGTHEDKIITASEQDQIRRILNMNYLVSGYQQDKQHLFTGLLRCALCGYPCKAQAVKKTKAGVTRRYQCRNYCHNRSCTAKGMILESAIEEVVIETLSKHARAIADTIDLDVTKAPPPELIQLKQKLEKLEKLGEDEPEIKALKSRIQAEIKAIEQRSHIEDSSKSELRRMITEALSDPVFFRMQSEENRRSLYLQVIEKIVIGQEEKFGRYRNGKNYTRLIAFVKEINLRC